MAWSEDVPKRFEAYGWHAQRVEDGNDVEAIAEAITAAREDDRPSLIAVRTHIGFGSPNRQDTQKAHGQPLGADEVRLVKESYGWDPDKSFYVPDDALRLFREAVPAGEALVEAWDEAMDAYASDHPDLAAELRRRLASPERLATAGTPACKTYADGEEVATRNASQDAIQALAGPVPELFGGAADLSRIEPDRSSRAAATSSPTTPGGTSGTASASTRWAAPRTGSPTTAASSRTPARS